MRSLLAEAEQGNLIGMVAATLRSDGTIKKFLCGTPADSPALAATIAARLKARIDLLLLA